MFVFISGVMKTHHGCIYNSASYFIYLIWFDLIISAVVSAVFFTNSNREHSKIPVARFISRVLTHFQVSGDKRYMSIVELSWALNTNTYTHAHMHQYIHTYKQACIHTCTVHRYSTHIFYIFTSEQTLIKIYWHPWHRISLLKRVISSNQGNPVLYWILGALNPLTLVAEGEALDKHAAAGSFTLKLPSKNTIWLSPGNAWPFYSPHTGRGKKCDYCATISATIILSSASFRKLPKPIHLKQQKKQLHQLLHWTLLLIEGN